MAYLDLDELPEALDGSPLVASARRPAARCASAASDYLGDPARPLAEAVRAPSRRAAAARPAGPVRLLTQLRSLGHCFNPVSFYYCFERTASACEAVLAEVTNTPWGERHAYVLERGDAAGRVLRDRMDKVFHVSPFMGMDQRYDWRVTEPGDSLQVHIEPRGRQVALRRDAVARAARAHARPPAPGACPLPADVAAVVARIYAHALRLKLKGAPLPLPSGAAMSGRRRALVQRPPRASRSRPRDAELRASVTVHSPRRFWRSLAARLSPSASPRATPTGLGQRRPRRARADLRARDGAARPPACADRPARARQLACAAEHARARSRRHIAAHYDLGNELFALFLDESMTYSCAVFDPPHIDAASRPSTRKLDRVCRKLELGPGRPPARDRHRLGRVAVHAAGAYGCRVTTTTISREQHAHASQRVRDAGLEDRVTVLLDDYRELSGSYDKLVSIEMIEAVGWQHFDDLLPRAARDLLAARRR